MWERVATCGIADGTTLYVVPSDLDFNAKRLQIAVLKESVENKWSDRVGGIF
jgi:hypothetical protein